jgi:predicted DCC family thiol-disulfide oxidoreductase YuxK
MGTAPPLKEPDGPIVFFDGVCNLCSGAVKFVIKRDKKLNFKFASLQSAFAQNCFNQFGVSETFESIVLYQKGEFYTKSDAALAIARKLDFPWPLLYGLKIIPKGIRNVVYDFIASNRYRWFGKSDRCMIPTPEISERFVG